MSGAKPADKLVGLILAGGQSRRMGGGDKALTAFGGGTLLQFVAGRLEAQVTDRVISANGDPDEYRAVDLPVVADPLPGHVGPLAGILAGLQWAAENHPDARFVLSVAADTPFFPDTLASRLGATVSGSDEPIVLAASNGRVHPVIGLWPVALANDLETWLIGGQSRKVLAFVDRHRSVQVSFDDSDAAVAGCDPFFNTNTPDDMTRAADYLERYNA